MKKYNLILGVLFALMVTTNASSAEISMDVIQSETLIETTQETVAELPEELLGEGTMELPGETSVLDDTVLEAVTGLTTCSLNKTKVKLEWNAVEGADYYYISRSNLKGKNLTNLAETEKCVFTDTTIKYNKEYIYYVTPVQRVQNEDSTEESVEVQLESLEENFGEVVEEIQVLEGPTSEITFSNKKVVATNHQKYSYLEMEEDIELLYKKYNGLVEYSVLGTSADGRAIYDVVIGNPEAEKSLLVVSTLHAREYMCSLLTMNQIEYYLEKYYGSINGKKVANVLDDICIHYIPMANPDGVCISQEGFDGIMDDGLRKKLKKMGGNTTRWKANARGVDLNQNFPFQFKIKGKRGDAGYSGTTAASEPEVKAIIKVVKALKKNQNLQGIVNYHAMGSIIFNGIAGCSKEVATDIKRMYKDAKSVTKYTDEHRYYRDTLKGSHGNSKEYYTCKLGIPSITIEIGRETCPGPIKEFPAIWKENKDVVIRQAGLFI